MKLALLARIALLFVLACRGEREVPVDVELATAEREVTETTACNVTQDARCMRCELAGAITAEQRKTLARALDVSPRSFLQASALKRVVLCETLTPADQRRDDEAPGGTIDPARGALLLRADLFDLAIVQHELFHLFDIQAPHVDKEWLALNPKGFRYGQARMVDGFVRPYSLTSAREDKATVYEAIVTRQLCRADPIVIVKGRLLRTRIREAIGDDAKFLDELAPCLVP